MKKNMRYVLDNAQGRGNLVDWLMCMNHFFGEEQTDAFCDYYIDVHQILRTEDIRNLLPRHSLSVYWAMEKEQLAFLSLYHVIDRETDFVKNRENGFKKVQEFYRKKVVDLARRIRKLGYSYVPIKANWKEKKQKDGYQREYIFCIFSETDTKEEFQQKMLELAKSIHQNRVLITETIQEKVPKYVISSNIYDVASGEILESNSDTTIPVVEKYLGDLTGEKVVFKIPYERNKTVELLEKPELGSYYARTKRKMVKNAQVHSCNMGMLKQSLLQSFQRNGYDE